MAAVKQTTGIQNLDLDALLSHMVRVPSEEHQRAISGFLDTETARIDALVTKRRRMIDLLLERHRAFQADLVLHGSNPLHPASFQGLPAGWKTGQLGVLLALHRGYDLPLDQREPGDVPVVSSGGLSGVHSVPMCVAPGVVTGRYGTIGEVFYLDEPYWPLNTTLYVSDYRGNDARWVFHLLSVLPLAYDAEKSAVTGINRNVIGSLRAPRPPLDVQREVADRVDASWRDTEHTVKLLRRQVALLHEHRQALVTAAVTGELALPGLAV